MSIERNKFNTNNRKIDNLINAQEEQSIQKNRQKVQNKETIEQIRVLDPEPSIIKKSRNFNQDWAPMEIENNFGAEPSSLSFDTQYKTWEVVFDRLDENLIPFIKVEMLFRVGEGNIDDGVIMPAFFKNHFFEIEELEENSRYKKVTLKALLWFSEGNVYQGYEAKLIVSIDHPQKDF